MTAPQCFIMNHNRIVSQNACNGINQNNDAKPPITKEKVMSYEEKSVGSTPFFKCEACPYMALAEDDIKFHLFTVHPELAKTNGLADNIQIPCPGCTNIFDAEETLRTHLRNHHKMGIKDVKKMVKSLVQIALKNAKLKKEDQKDDERSPSIPNRQDAPDVKMPEVIEIVPDVSNASHESFPKGVAFISVDELHKMSTPNFEKIDPKEIIQEASINIVYNNDISTQYVKVSDASTSNSACNIMQMSSVPPDLISSIQTRATPTADSKTPAQLTITNDPSKQMTQMPKQGRPRIAKKDPSTKEIHLEEKLGKLCSFVGCTMRLKDPEKLVYHRKCHQNGNLQCPECNQLFVSVDQLHTHLWKLHFIDLELPTCDICGYKTFKNRLYNIHMQCHGVETPYSCATCSKSFKTAKQLSKHRMLHKKSAQPIQCPTCQQEFNTERRLRCHVMQVHEKVRPFKCGHCDYTAARKEELKLHLRSHTGDKPYSCDHCSYRSGDHNAMRRHKKTHSKESLYQCKHCPYSSIQSTTFASHMISKHPHVTSSDIHRCPYCPFKTVKKEKYVVHLTSHPDKEGVKLLIEMSKGTVSKPSWTIPSESGEAVTTDNGNANDGNDVSTKKTVNDISIEVYDCDSQQDGLTQKYPNSYSTHTASDSPNVEFSNKVVVTDSNKQHDNNSDCLISESCSDALIDRRQYAAPHCLQSLPYEPAAPDLHFLTTAVSIEQNILQSSNPPPLPAGLSPASRPSIMTNFPIRLPPLPQMSVRNHITLKPVDKIFPMTKVTGPIIKPTQILPVPSSSNSPVSMTTADPEGGPRKKPKISVKSNMILKGPDSANMFHSQQKMAFKRLEDNERFGLGPVTFNNLITTQFMQLPPEPTLSESPNSLSYPPAPLEAATPPAAALGDSDQMFTFNQQLTASPMMLPPRPKLQPTDPSYIKLEGTIKQNTQSPSLERMCNANIQNITREYKASPPLEDIHKNMSEIKNEVKSDYYSIPMNSTAASQPMMDQYLIDNIIGEQYVSGHLDLSNIALPLVDEDQQNDVIEIDDNSDDTKLLQRFDMNFPIESMYLMHNDFHFLDNEMPSNNVSEVPVNEMNRMVTEVPIVNQKDSLSSEVAEASNDFPNFIQGKKDPMMNTSVRPSTNKINVKNIELMKN